MKKIYAVSLVFSILLSVITVGCGGMENNVSQRTQTEETVQTEEVVQTEEPVQTEKPAASASPIVSEEETEEKSGKDKKRKVKSVTVIDETGKNCKLRLGDLDETDAGFGFCSSYFGEPSQVSDGHYYYLHMEKEGEYTIYRDKKVVEGHFFIKEGEVTGFAKIGTDYFATIMYVEESPADINVTYDIVRIDLAAESVEILVEDCASFGNAGEQRIDVDEIIFYRGSMYYDSRTDVPRDAIWEPGDYLSGNFLISRSLDNIDQESKMTCTKQMNKAKPYLTFVDGKILYGRQKGKEVSLYMFDLETREQTKFLSYKRKKAYIRDQSYSDDSVLLSVDDDYIYCQDMAIPRKGGKMQPLLKNALSYLGSDEIVFSSNKEYIFYLDKKYHLHRIDKKTEQDTLISDKKLMSVQCMEDRVYVKVLRQGFWEAERWDECPDILYCMNLDGTVKWKHKLKGIRLSELFFDDCE